MTAASGPFRQILQRANVGVQGNSGSRRRMPQTTRLTDAVEKGLVIFGEQ
jgi:hypothetical protein